MEKRNAVGMAWSVIWPILLYELISLLTGITADIYSLRYTSMELTILVGIVTALVFGVICYTDRKRSGTEMKALHSGDIPGVLKVTVGSAVLSVTGNILIAFTPLVEWSESFQRVSITMSQESFPVLFLASVLIAPISEELLMRGVIYGRMRIFLSSGKAIVLSSLLFGLFHANIVQGVFAFMMGMLFAAVMERYQNILVPILAHMSANLIIVILTF